MFLFVSHCRCYFISLVTVACKEGHPWWSFALLLNDALAGLFSSGVMVFSYQVIHFIFSYISIVG
jgi:hypothetical protein